MTWCRITFKKDLCLTLFFFFWQRLKSHESEAVTSDRGCFFKPYQSNGHVSDPVAFHKTHSLMLTNSPLPFNRKLPMILNLYFIHKGKHKTERNNTQLHVSILIPPYYCIYISNYYRSKVHEEQSRFTLKIYIL